MLDGIPELLEERYIFKKGNIKEIIKILKNININEYYDVAKRNIEISNKYDKESLEKRRLEFYMKFIMD